jgi:hypothetical protein
MSNYESLDQRIASALADKAIASSDLANLIGEVETAIVAADKAAMDVRGKTLDPTAVIDVEKASVAATAANLIADRLKAALPKLHTHHQQIVALEAFAAWLPRHKRVKARRDALAVKMRELYTQFVEGFVPLLMEIEQADAEVQQVNASKPIEGGPPSLRSVELEARGLDGFGPNGLSIVRDLKLPAWDVGLLWPPYRPIDLAMITPRIGGDPRLYTGDWWRVKEEQARAHSRQGD